MEDTLTVTRNDAAGRYEIHVAGVLGGFTEFQGAPNGEVIFPHTEVDPACRGRGPASPLPAGAWEAAARRGDRIVPLCPFVQRYLKENEVPGLDVDWSAASQRGASG